MVISTHILSRPSHAPCEVLDPTLNIVSIRHFVLQGTTAPEHSQISIASWKKKEKKKVNQEIK